MGPKGIKSMGLYHQDFLFNARLLKLTFTGTGNIYDAFVGILAMIGARI